MQENGDVVDLLTTHRYFNDPDAYRHDIDVLRKNRQRYGVDTDRRRKDRIQIGYTEYNTTDAVAEDSWDRAVWHAEVMNYFLEGGVDMACIWHIAMGGEHALYRVNLAGDYAPLPSHYVLQFYHDHIDFDKSPRVVRSTHLSRNLSMCAVEQGNDLMLFVVNPSTNVNEEITLAVDGQHYAGEVDIDTMLEGTNGEWTIGETTSSTAPMQDGSITYTFPAHSIVAIKFKDPGNYAPVATDDTYWMVEGSTTVLDILSNDSDLNEDLLSIATFTQPAFGSITDNGDGTVTHIDNGVHLGSDGFTYSVTDGVNTSETAVVSLSLYPQEPVSFDSVEDTYAYENVTDGNYGERVYLELRGGSNFDRYAYLKFDVSGLEASAVAATLKVFSNNHVGNLSAYAVADNSWTELGLTWGNMPASGSLLGSATAETNSWVEIPLGSDFITTNGTYSIMLMTTVNARTTLSSREGANSPVLDISMPAPASSDSDADGIADDWEMEYIGNLVRVNASSDADNDGIIDSDEYILDYSPAVSNAPFSITIVGGESAVKVQFDSRASRAYTVDYVTNLMNSEQWELLEPAQSGSNGVHIVTDPDAEDSFRAYRVKVSIP
ncbi:DNRLRE domain-containing protein [Verrucomicrobiota bacterium]